MPGRALKTVSALPARELSSSQPHSTSPCLGENNRWHEPCSFSKGRLFESSAQDSKYQNALRALLLLRTDVADMRACVPW